MWHDVETTRDLLNFRVVAETAAQLVLESGGQPLSIGVSGNWGTGKSSLLKMIGASLKKADAEEKKYIFLEFNAWLYQGYDDARMALLQSVSDMLVAESKQRQTHVEKALEFAKRVRWFQVGKLLAPTISGAILGGTLAGPVGAVIGAVGGLCKTDGVPSAADLAKVKEAYGALQPELAGLLKEKGATSLPQEIAELRKSFEGLLSDLDVTLVVLVDDLDRCLPDTAISTLEAMRLLLFLPRTAFVIAADEQMIRGAVRVHFGGVDLSNDLVTSYFDKLIQVPIRVPPLGTQDVRAYLMLLFVENSGLTEGDRNRVREQVCTQLSTSWQGRRVDRAFMASVVPNCPAELRAKFDLADRLAPLMTTANQIAGNPRLIKRFLNTLYIRMTVARSQGVSVDEAVLAKMLLFERCGHKDAYRRMVQAINDHEQGKPAFLKAWEERTMAGEEIKDLPPEWSSEFAQSWLALPPSVADLDLRAVVYVSREHLPIITASDLFSTEAAELLEGLMQVKDQISEVLKSRLQQIQKRETALIMDRLLTRARQEQSWGTPSILYGCLTVVAADPDQGARLAEHLQGISAAQLTASLIPVLSDKPWATPLLAHWQNAKDTPDRVKRAILAQTKRTGV